MSAKELTINSALSLHKALEEWRHVPGYEGEFEASSFGRVRSVARRVRTRGENKYRWIKSRIVGKNIGTSGYHRVTVCARKHQHESVHRMVAMAFVPNPCSLPCINHIDGDKTNNVPSNLEWCTHAYNMRHAFNTGLTPRKRLKKGDGSIASKLTSDDVREIKQRIRNGERVSDIANEYPVSKSALFEIKAGRSWGHIQ